MAMGIFLNLQRTGSDWVLLRSENFRVLITFSYLQDYYYYYYYYYYTIIKLLLYSRFVLSKLSWHFTQ